MNREEAIGRIPEHIRRDLSESELELAATVIIEVLGHKPLGPGAITDGVRRSVFVTKHHGHKLKTLLRIKEAEWSRAMAEGSAVRAARPTMNKMLTQALARGVQQLWAEEVEGALYYLDATSLEAAHEAQ